MAQRWPLVAAIVYDMIQRPLTRQCQAEKLDFNKLFPKPRGLDAVRQQRAMQSQRQ